MSVPTAMKPGLACVTAMILAASAFAQTKNGMEL